MPFRRPTKAKAPEPAPTEPAKPPPPRFSEPFRWETRRNRFVVAIRPNGDEVRSKEGKDGTATRLCPNEDLLGLAVRAKNAFHFIELVDRDGPEDEE